MTTLEMDSIAGPWPPLSPNSLPTDNVGDWGSRQKRENLHRQVPGIAGQRAGWQESVLLWRRRRQHETHVKAVARWLINSSVNPLFIAQLQQQWIQQCCESDTLYVAILNPLRKSVLNIHWKGWYWSWSFNTLATWCKKLNHWKRLWCLERMKTKGEEGGRGWDV